MDPIPNTPLPALSPLRGQAKTRLLAVLIALLAPAVQANEGPWYQVEVILFAQSDPYRAEANLKSVRPAYPDNRVFLDADDGAGDPGELARLSPADLTLYRAMVPDRQLRWRNPREPVPYASLDPSERLLGDDARALAGSGTYQVLYHQAWRQTLGTADTSPWLVVQGGRSLGQHHELEGSLRVYRSDDGHIAVATRLWRPRFGPPAPTADPAAESASPASVWPTLPAPPSRPLRSLPGFLAPAEEDSPEGFDTAATPPPAAQILVDLDMLDQTQIINSRELHYLDHPRLGALIRVVPYTLPGDEADQTSADLPEAEQGFEEPSQDSDEPRD